MKTLRCLAYLINAIICTSAFIFAFLSLIGYFILLIPLWLFLAVGLTFIGIICVFIARRLDIEDYDTFNDATTQNIIHNFIADAEFLAPADVADGRINVTILDIVEDLIFHCDDKWNENTFRDFVKSPRCRYYLKEIYRRARKSMNLCRIVTLSSIIMLIISLPIAAITIDSNEYLFYLAAWFSWVSIGILFKVIPYWNRDRKEIHRIEQIM
jgi:hypothetical protein